MSMHYEYDNAGRWIVMLCPVCGWQRRYDRSIGAARARGWLRAHIGREHY